MYANVGIFGSGSHEHKEKRTHYSEIRDPMIKVLLRDYKLSFDDILKKASEIPEKKIPTIKVCEQVQNIILGNYLVG